MRYNIRRSTALLSALLMFVIILAAIPTVSAAQVTITGNKKVYISKLSYVQLTNANLIPSASGTTASFTFTFYNGENSALVLNDYWARLKSVSGAKHTLTLLEQDKKKIAPKSSTTLTFYSQVGPNTTLDQLVISIVKFDFNVSGYERTIAQYTFPKGYMNYVKAGGYKPVQINNSTVNIRVDQINVTKKDDSYVLNLSYVARNISKFGVDLPQYNYYVQTSAGLYKLSLKNKTDETLLLEPAVLNAIRITGSIPSSLSIKDWKLIITNSVGTETSKVELPIVIFDIPFKVGNTNSSTGTAVTTIANDYGMYEVELKQVQRIPWTTKDQVIAEVVIRNKESVFLPLPDITGQFVVDENIKLNSKILVSGEDIGLAPGASTSVHYIGEIPISYNWKKFMLQLNEKNGEETSTLAELTKSTLTAVKTVKLNETYAQTIPGYQLTAKVTDVKTFTNDSSDLYAVYLDVTNTQNRSTILSSWTGFFKTSDGNYYEAKSIKSSNVIKPSNKEQVIVYAELPVNASKDSIQLLLGEAFDDNGVIKGSGEAKGYIRPIELELPSEKTDTISFKQLKIGPYTVDMTYFNSFIEFGWLDLDLGATVTKDHSYDGFMQSKLIIELERETTGQTILSHVVDLEYKKDGETLWKVGDNYNEIRKDLTNTPLWDSYTLNIYETIEGHKKKLASTEIKWSQFINWLEDK